jgi:hypothetical protein
MGSPVSLLSPDRLLTADRLVTRDALALAPEVGHLIGREMLDRGQWILCQGHGAVSLAAAMLGAATQQGSWLAVLATPTLGLEACRELGVDLRRVIAVDADLTTPMQWAERLVACSDGCDLVVTTMPHRVPERIWRSVSQRTRRNGTVVVGLDPGLDPGLIANGFSGVDLRCRVINAIWEGLGRGTGRLVARRLEVEVTARRLPGSRRGQIALVCHHS